MDTNNKTVEELNELLYEKMEREQAEYKQSLVDMEPLEILNHAYEYAVREDIVYCILRQPTAAEAELNGRGAAPTAGTFPLLWQRKNPS